MNEITEAQRLSHEKIRLGFEAESILKADIKGKKVNTFGQGAKISNNTTESANPTQQ